MSLENPTYINGLIVTNPTSSDPVSQGDDHLKLIKSTLKNTFPNVTGAVTTTHAEINLLNNATNAATNSTLVKRNSSGAASFSTVYATTLTGTLSSAAQTSVTSVGALNGGSITSGFGSINTGSSSISTSGSLTAGSVTVDSVKINGNNIGHTSDSDLISLSSGSVSVAGSFAAQSISTTGNISLSGNISVTGTVDGVDVAGLNTALSSGTVSDSRIANILDKVYPVGSIYTSMTRSTSPASIFGGVWSAVGEGRVLIGHGQGTDSNGDTQTFAVGTADTDGEYTHTLTTAEMPSHRHNTGVVGKNSRNFVSDQRITVSSQNGFDDDNQTGTASSATTYAGDGNAHNNVQPYLTVYMWKRDS